MRTQCDSYRELSDQATEIGASAISFMREALRCTASIRYLTRWAFYSRELRARKCEHSRLRLAIFGCMFDQSVG